MPNESSCGRTRAQRRRIPDRSAPAPVKGRFREPLIKNSTRNDPVNLASMPPVSTLLANAIAVLIPISVPIFTFNYEEQTSCQTRSCGQVEDWLT